VKTGLWDKAGDTNGIEDTENTAEPQRGCVP